MPYLVQVLPRRTPEGRPVKPWSGEWIPLNAIFEYKDRAEEEARHLSDLYHVWTKVEEVSENDPRVKTASPKIWIREPSERHKKLWYQGLSIHPPSAVSKAGALALRLSRTHLFIPSTDVEAVRDRVRKTAIKLLKK